MNGDNGIIDIPELSGLSAQNVRISDLDSLSTLKESDVFVVSRKIEGHPWYTHDSCILEFNVLSNYIIDNKLSSADITINCDCSFGKKDLSNVLKIKTSVINSEILSGNKNCIINIDYFEKNILKKIYDLSNEIYVQNHIPSHVGEIIFSDTLTSEALVKQRYGSTTEWRKLTGMILGVGGNEENTTLKYGDLAAGKINKSNNETGGNKSVTLNSNNIPKHKHKFDADTCKFTMSWYMSFINEKFNPEEHSTGTYFYDFETQTTLIQSESGQATAGFYKVKKGTASVMSATFSNSKSESTKSLFNNSTNIQLSEIWNLNDSKQITNVLPHNNIPPIITKYVWERIK